jgi:hypothetical protein
MESERELRQTDQEPPADQETAVKERGGQEEGEEDGGRELTAERDERLQRQQPGTERVDDQSLEPLFPDEELARDRTRWDEIQARFVDEPRTAVEQADSLVSELLERVTAELTEGRSRLEGQWARGEEVLTEDLRLALRRYRSFFNRLLAA